jgi:hypothetical protein
MTVSTYADRRSCGIVGLMTGWLAGMEESRRTSRDFASIEGLNDQLLRDIGMRSEPSRKHGRQLARFRETL